MSSLMAPVNASFSPTVWSSNFGQRMPGVSSRSSAAPILIHCFARVTRLIGCLRLDRAGQAVDEGRLADVRDAEDHAARRARPTAVLDEAVRLRSREFLRLRDKLLHAASLDRVNGDSRDTLRAEIREPALRARRIREVRLVERDKARLLLDDLRQHRVGTARRDACIEQLDDDIDELQILLDQPLRLFHMAREPLDSRQVVSCFFIHLYLYPSKALPRLGLALHTPFDSANTSQSISIHLYLSSHCLVGNRWAKPASRWASPPSHQS